MATPGSAALTAEDKETTRYWLDASGNVYYSRGSPSAPCLCDAAPAPALEYTDLGRAKDMQLYSTPPGSPAVTPVASPESDGMLDRLDIAAEKHDENRAWWEQNIRGLGKKSSKQSVAVCRSSPQRLLGLLDSSRAPACPPAALRPHPSRVQS